MRADAAEADRRLEVREAAQGWRRAQAIPEAALASVHAAYPEDRNRLGPVFRLLVFSFTMMAANSCFGGFGFVLASGHEMASATLLVLFGLALVTATEYQLGPLRRRQSGAEAATAFLGLCYSTGGLVWFLSEASLGDAATINGALGLAALLFGAAAYRWGYSAFAAVAGIAFFLLLARGPWGRALWILVPLLTTPLLLRAGDSARLPPAHRRGSQALAALGLIFFYMAVHIGSWDEGLVEVIGDHYRGRGNTGHLRTLSIAGTALVPVLTLGWGIAARRRLLIDLGLVGVLASLVTLRFYVQVAPLWVVLLLGGAIALGLALALRRFLHSGPEHERHGFTAEPLFADPEGRSALEVAAGMASLTPTARPIEKAGFEGGGGSFGGGGASGKF